MFDAKSDQILTETDYKYAEFLLGEEAALKAEFERYVEMERLICEGTEESPQPIETRA